jgi:hypothetical protein
VRAERLDHYDSEFAAHLDESGTPRETVTPEVREKVVGLMDREGLTADAAFERVLMEETDHAAQTGKVEPTGLGEEIPGWNVPDDAGAVPRPSGESAPVGARYGYPGEPVGSPVRPADIQTPRQDLGRSTVLVDKAGNIRLDLINSTEDINAYLRETALANDDFLTERRGRVPDNMIAPLAEMLGMDAKYLDKKKIGDAYNDREIYALFQGLLQAAADVKAKHEKFFSTKADEDFIAYQQAQEKLVMWQGKTSGATAEAGRALRVFQLLKNMEGMGEASSLAAKSAKFLAERELKAETGKTLFQMKQDALKAGPLQTPAEIAKFAADSHKPTWKDKFQEAWVNSLLSGIKTAGINVQGNFIPLVVGFPEKLVAGAVGAVDRAVTGSKGGVRIGEAKAELYSLYQGLQDGAIAFKEIIKNEQKAETALRDIERRNYGRESKLLEKEGIEAELNPTERHFRRSIGGTTGQVVRMPGRALAATDAAFKAVHHRKEISAQAYRIASEEVDAGKIKTQDGFVKRVNELERNPTEEMLNNAEKKATDDTYNSPLGNAGNALATLTQSSLPAKIIMPFVRTPVNLVKWAGRRTPLGLFAKSVRDDIMGKNGKVAQQMAIGRMTVGTTIAATSIGLALNGMITGGGPTDPGERENWLHDHQPYSIKIGGDWYSYGRLDPVATLLGTTADLVDNAHKIPDGEYEKAAMGLMTSVYKNIISKTYLSGVTSAAQAVSDPERYGGHWIQRLAGTAVPSFISQMNMMPVIGDPYLREVHGILDVYKSRIPGLRQTLQVRRDVFGEPIQPGETREDAVVSAMRDVNYFPAKMGKKIAGVETTPEEYDDLTRIAGRMAKEQLDHLVGSPNFDSIPSVKRAELMKQIVDHARKSARQLVAAQYPRIIKQAHDDRLADLEID